MTATKLLLWMSARGQGSWQQFRSAVEELHLTDGDSDTEPQEEDDSGGRFTLPIYQILRLNLQRLGHAEFFAGASDSEWRVTPPSLAVTKHACGWFGILAGARSSELLQRVYDADALVVLERLWLPAYPEQIRMASDNVDALKTMADRAGLVLQMHAPSAILANLPPINDAAMRRQTDLPLGKDWRVERFSVSKLGWVTATRKEALSSSVGLYRFSLRYQRYVLLCLKGTAYMVPGQVGKYIVLRHRRSQVLSYDATSRRLSVPAPCRPPFLVERALILCSGLPPSYEAGSGGTGLLHYSGVPKSVAAVAAALLKQELR